jgi:ribosomal protein L37E
MACGGCKARIEVSKLQMAANVGGAAGRAFKALVQGQPVFSAAQMVLKRHMICKACPSQKYISELDRCAACGCFILKSIVGAPGKATLANEKCPKGHW